MAKPIERSSEIAEMLEATTGMISGIKNDVCWNCKRDALIFKDELSRKEFSVSGLCQHCQDEVFA